MTQIGVFARDRFLSLIRDKNYPFKLKPHDVTEYSTPPLPTFFKLEPGEYTMNVVYSEQVMGSPLKLVARPIVIQVVD